MSGTLAVGNAVRFWPRLATKGTLLSFSASTCLVGLVNSVASVVMLRWVPPEAMGIWQSALLIQTAADLLKIGMINGMNREFPLLMARGDEAAASRVVATAAAWVRWTSISGLAVFGCLIALRWQDGTAWRLATTAAALQWAVAWQGNFLQGLFRGGDGFGRLARIQLFTAVCGLAMLPIVAVGGLAGLCVRAVCQSVICTTLLWRARPVPIVGRFDLRSAGEMLRSGAPLFISAYLFVAALAADGAILLVHGGPALVGFLAPVAAVQAACAMLPNAITQYVYPRLSATFGRTGDPQAVWQIATRAGGLSVGLVAVMAMVGWVAAEPLVELFFPAYRRSLAAMHWALLSGVFLAIRPIAAVIPVLRAWRWHYAWIGVFCLAKWLLGQWFAASATDPLEGVAIAGTFASAASAMLIVAGSFLAATRYGR